MVDGDDLAEALREVDQAQAVAGGRFVDDPDPIPRGVHAPITDWKSSW